MNERRWTAPVLPVALAFCCVSVEGVPRKPPVAAGRSGATATPTPTPAGASTVPPAAGRAVPRTPTPGTVTDKTPGAAAGPPASRRLPITDGGHSGTYDPGVDLVISKVVLRRNTTPATGEPIIESIVTVKNMAAGRVQGRVWIQLAQGPGNFRSRYFDTGIPPLTEVDVWRVDFPDPDGRTELRLTAMVDDADVIRENNEENNSCSDIFLPSGIQRREKLCPILGPHDR